jgi:tetratricopeptide (TPR) repeat protein
VIPALRRAFRLADSLPERERSAIEGFYHWHVTGDLSSSIAAFRRHLEALKDFPSEVGFVSEAAATLQLSGDPAEAERVVRELKRLMEQAGTSWPAGRSSGGVQLTHVRLLHELGSDAEAARILEEYSRRRPESTRALHLRIGFLADSGRYEGAHALAGRLRRQSSLRNDARVQAEVDAVRGRLGEAVGHLLDLRDQALALDQVGAAMEIAAAAARLRLAGGDSSGVSEIDDLLARHPVDSLDVLSRPYLPLALWYAQAGQPRRARAWLRRYEREFPPEFQGPDRWMLHRARAAAFAAEGNPARSLAELREASRFPALRVGLFDEPYIRLSDAPELGRLYQRLGEPDSAVAVYRRYLAARPLTRLVADAFERGPTLEALGALYDQRGDRALAVAAYGDFAALWREADAVLQPRVEAARRRAAELNRN